MLSQKLFLEAKFIAKIYTSIVSSFDMADENLRINPCRSFGWRVYIGRKEDKMLKRKCSQWIIKQCLADINSHSQIHLF